MRSAQPPESRKSLPRVDEASLKLPREVRLRHRSEFLRVQRDGRAVRSVHVVALVRDNGLLHRRLGVTVSSRIGNAVVRNRLKRWFREIFRHHRNQLPPGIDLVLIARTGSRELSFKEVSDEVVGLFEKLQLERVTER